MQLGNQGTLGFTNHLNGLTFDLKQIIWVCTHDTHHMEMYARLISERPRSYHVLWFDEESREKGKNLLESYDGQFEDM